MIKNQIKISQEILFPNKKKNKKNYDKVWQKIVILNKFI